MTVTDMAGNSSAAAQLVVIANDLKPPTNGSISYPNSVVSGHSATITFEQNGDPQSGVAGYKLQRARAMLKGGVCGTWGPFGVIGGAAPKSPYLDITLLPNMCYSYRLLVTDKAGNTAAYTSPNVVKVDAIAPTGTINVSAIDPATNITTITGSSTDLHTSVTSVKVTYRGLTSGTICTPTDATIPWSCTFDTTSLTSGAYTIAAVLIDSAGNTRTVSKLLRVVRDACPNLSGMQPTPQSGMILLNGSCVGTAVNNVIIGQAGVDIIDGGLGNDTILGAAGDDTLIGSIGNDAINGGPGNDALQGGDGNDAINANDAAPGDSIDCGLGVDTVTIDKGDTTTGCEKVITR